MNKLKRKNGVTSVPKKDVIAATKKQLNDALAGIAKEALETFTTKTYTTADSILEEPLELGEPDKIPHWVGRMEKPREFWVLTKNHNGLPTDDFERECFNYEPVIEDQEELTHVIEKSAYDQLLADARELQKALDKIRDGNFQDAEGMSLIAEEAFETFAKKYGAG